MPEPPSSPYQVAQRAARQRIGAVDERTARQIQAALAAFADRIGAGLANLPAGESAEFVVRRAAERLDEEIAKAVAQNRDVSFESVVSVWRDAQATALESVGAGALLGRGSVPPLTMLGQYESLGAAESWRTLIRGRVFDAAREANAIVRSGIAENVDRPELARRLRRYVVGSEQFDELFEQVPTATGEVAKIDLRRLPADLKGAARQMEFNARRIAFTEMHNARKEAEVQHFLRDPLIKAVRWTLSPDRGSARIPDECDLLAEADWYDLGPGIFPVSAVPTEPHPFGRCLAPWTPVLTGQGWTEIRAVKAGDRVWTHEGRLCRVERRIEGEVTGSWLRVTLDDGSDLVVTEDHRILTPDGWREAGTLRGGESVVGLDRVPDDDFHELGLAGAAGGRPGVAGEDEKFPAPSLKQLFLAPILRLLFGAPVPPTVDLDRQLRGGHGHVDVEPAEGPERLRLDPLFDQPVPDPLLVLRELGLILVDRLRPLSTGLLRLLASGEELLRVLGQDLALLGVPLEAEDVGLRLAAAGDTVPQQVLPDDVPAEPQALGHDVLGELLVDVELEQVLLRDSVFRPQLTPREIRHVEPLAVKFRRYCLAVAKDNSFIAGGVVVHNCEHMPVTRSTTEAGLPKPDPDRILVAEDANLRMLPQGDALTEAAAQRLRDSAERAVRVGESLQRRLRETA